VPSSPQKEFGYRNGELLVTAAAAGDVRWLVADQLGTPRMIADRSGSLSGIRRHDYLPFGEELSAGTGGRTTAQGYSNSDGNRKKWAQLERDDETGLDYAEARYYSSTQGRFTSSDPFAGSMQITDPQSLNRYAYSNNSPLIHTDPTGMEMGFMGFRSNGWTADIEARFGSRDNTNEIAEAEEAYVDKLADTWAAIAEAKTLNEGLASGMISGDVADYAVANNPLLQMVAQADEPGRLDILDVVLDSNNNGGCTRNANQGIQVEVSYQVQNREGAPIREAGMIPIEEVTENLYVQGNKPAITFVPKASLGPKDPNTNPHNTGKTNAQGIFTDAPLGLCLPVPFSLNSTQKLWIKRGKTEYKVGVMNLTINGNKIKLVYEPPKGVPNPQKIVRELKRT
jgi:RHS repeat-associated protein